MKTGLFLEFPRQENGTYQEAFQAGFALVDEAESLGIQSVLLAEYHFNAGRVLFAPLTIAGAAAVRRDLGVSQWLSRIMDVYINEGKLDPHIAMMNDLLLKKRNAAQAALGE